MTNSDQNRISDDQHNNAPAAPQGWKMDRDGADAIVISHHAVGLAKACNPPRSAHEHLLFMLCDDILQDGDTLAPAPAPARGEPFGYFRAEPFGWTDCAKDDEGAIALYEHPAKPAQEVGLTDDEIDRVVLEAVGFEGYGCQAMNKADMRGVSRAIISALRAKGDK